MLTPERPLRCGIFEATYYILCNSKESCGSDRTKCTNLLFTFFSIIELHSTVLLPSNDGTLLKLTLRTQTSILTWVVIVSNATWQSPYLDVASKISKSFYFCFCYDCSQLINNRVLLLLNLRIAIVCKCSYRRFSINLQNFAAFVDEILNSDSTDFPPAINIVNAFRFQ